MAWHGGNGTFAGTVTRIAFAFACLLPLSWSFGRWPTGVGSALVALDSVLGIRLNIDGGERDLSVELRPAFPPVVVGATGN